MRCSAKESSRCRNRRLPDTLASSTAWRCRTSSACPARPRSSQVVASYKRTRLWADASSTCSRRSRVAASASRRAGWYSSVHSTTHGRAPPGRSPRSSHTGPVRRSITPMRVGCRRVWPGGGGRGGPMGLGRAGAAAAPCAAFGPGSGRVIRPQSARNAWAPRSASAAMVNEGLAPRDSGMIAPSSTARPGNTCRPWASRPSNTRPQASTTPSRALSPIGQPPSGWTVSTGPRGWSVSMLSSSGSKRHIGLGTQCGPSMGACPPPSVSPSAPSRRRLRRWSTWRCAAALAVSSVGESLACGQCTRSVPRAGAWEDDADGAGDGGTVNARGNFSTPFASS